MSRIALEKMLNKGAFEDEYPLDLESLISWEEPHWPTTAE